MRKKIVVLAGIVVAGVFAAGCASPPGWAQAGESTFRDAGTNAVYGVGRGDTGEEQVRSTYAKVEARNNLALARVEYVGDLMELFITANKEWFEVQHLDAFFADFEEAFKRHSADMAGSIVEQWVDAGGRLNGEGVFYSLVRQHLDSEFFEAAGKAAYDAIETHGEDVLLVDRGQVVTAWEELLEKAEARPIEALAPPEPGPEEDVKEEVDQEEKVEDEEGVEDDEEVEQEEDDDTVENDQA